MVHTYFRTYHRNVLNFAMPRQVYNKVNGKSNLLGKLWGCSRRLDACVLASLCELRIGFSQN